MPIPGHRARAPGSAPVRAALVVVALTLATSFVPTAAARGFCSNTIDGPSCPGLFCKDYNYQTHRCQTCVGDEPIIVCVRECDPPTGALPSGPSVAMLLVTLAPATIPTASAMKDCDFRTYCPGLVCIGNGDQGGYYACVGRHCDTAACEPPFLP